MASGNSAEKWRSTVNTKSGSGEVDGLGDISEEELPIERLEEPLSLPRRKVEEVRVDLRHGRVSAVVEQKRIRVQHHQVEISPSRREEASQLHGIAVDD